MAVITLVGPRKGDIAHVEVGTGPHDVLVSRGWKELGDLDDKAIRQLAPDNLKLPPRAKSGTLARQVQSAMLGAGESAEPAPEPDPVAKLTAEVQRRRGAGAEASEEVVESDPSVPED